MICKIFTISTLLSMFACGKPQDNSALQGGGGGYGPTTCKTAMVLSDSNYKSATYDVSLRFEEASDPNARLYATNRSIQVTVKDQTLIYKVTNVKSAGGLISWNIQGTKTNTFPTEIFVMNFGKMMGRFPGDKNSPPTSDYVDYATTNQFWTHAPMYCRPAA